MQPVCSGRIYSCASCRNPVADHDAIESKARHVEGTSVSLHPSSCGVLAWWLPRACSNPSAGTCCRQGPSRLRAVTSACVLLATAFTNVLCRPSLGIQGERTSSPACALCRALPPSRPDDAVVWQSFSDSACSSCSCELAPREPCMASVQHRSCRLNCEMGPLERRDLLTGPHTVADLQCSRCSVKLGWKYVRANARSRWVLCAMQPAASLDAAQTGIQVTTRVCRCRHSSPHKSTRRGSSS